MKINELIHNLEIARDKIGNEDIQFEDDCPECGHQYYGDLDICIDKNNKAWFEIHWNNVYDVTNT